MKLELQTACVNKTCSEEVFTICIAMKFTVNLKHKKSLFGNVMSTGCYINGEIPVILI